MTMFRGPVRTRGGTALVLATALGACQPRIALEAPKDPIVINLNVKIEQEVRVKVDRELQSLFEENPELFGDVVTKDRK